MLNVLAPDRLAQAAANAFKTCQQVPLFNDASVLSLVHEMANGAYNGTESFVLPLIPSLEKIENWQT